MTQQPLRAPPSSREHHQVSVHFADRLAHRGYNLILVARDAARLEDVAERLRAATGRTIEVLPADLSLPADVAKIERRLASDPAITVLVNNAGISLNGGLLQNGSTDSKS